MDPFVRAHWRDAAIGYGILAVILAPIAACAYFVGSGDSDPSLPPPTPMVIPTAQPWTPTPPYTGYGVLCADGWVSHSTGRGTCSHHGGER